MLRPIGGGGRSGEGGDGTFRPFISAASFTSVALRSAIKSDMSASKSLSSSSWRDSFRSVKPMEKLTSLWVLGRDAGGTVS